MNFKSVENNIRSIRYLSNVLLWYSRFRDILRPREFACGKQLQNFRIKLFYSIYIEWSWMFINIAIVWLCGPKHIGASQFVMINIAWCLYVYGFLCLVCTLVLYICRWFFLLILFFFARGYIAQFEFICCYLYGQSINRRSLFMRTCFCEMIERTRTTARIHCFDFKTMFNVERY